MRIAGSFKRGKGLFFIFFLSFNFALISADQKSEFKKDREARDTETKVDEYVKPYIDAGGFSGAVLMAKAGKVLLSKGYGMANYELGVLNTSKTKFQVASISKTFTAAAILILEDLYKWDRAFSTEKILKKENLKKIFSEQARGIGYPWFLAKRLNRRVAYYNGRSPGFTSYLDRYLDDDACIIILSNNYAPVPHLMIKDLASILFGEKYEVPAEWKPVKLEPKVLDGLTGRYQFGSDYYRPGAIVNIETQGDHLLMKWSDTFSSPLMPLSPTKFLDRNFRAIIIFEKDERGKVTGLMWRDTSDYPARKLEYQ